MRTLIGLLMLSFASTGVCQTFEGIQDNPTAKIHGYNFMDLSATSRDWRAMCIGLDGAVYASVYNGSIYKSTNGGVSFVDLSATSRNWRAMCTGLDGAVYASVVGGSIYKDP
jgi:hypothetical protein